MDYLFQTMISYRNFYSAYLKSIYCRRFRPEILKFSFNTEKQLLYIMQKITSHKYIHGGYFKFIVNDSKKRTIWAAQFSDRVVHHALCNILEPIFEKSFIYDNYACRTGKGNHKAILRLRSFINKLTVSGGGGDKRKKIYCLKCDISKYFDSIDHEVLKKIIHKKIYSPGLLWLIDLIIDSYSTIRGIPIGNLTSQLFANIYLNELDHFIKDKLGIRYYIRYMDDFVILDTDKVKLFEIRKLIKNFLNLNLKLELHPKKSEYCPVDKGVDFLGFIVFEKYILLRKLTVKRFMKKLRNKIKNLKSEDRRSILKKSFLSWYSYYHHGKSHRLIRKIYEKLWKNS